MLNLISTVLGILDKVFGYVSGAEIAQAQGTAQVETAAIQGTAAVEQKWSFVAWLIPAIALPVIVYEWKAILWDNVIMNGTTSTPALHGAMANIPLLVISGLFLHVWVNK